MHDSLAWQSQRYIRVKHDLYIMSLQGTISTEGSIRKLLYKEWASFSKLFKFQPLDTVRDYYGVKIALYFAWLGFYTSLLLPPSIMGLLVFLYGLASRGNDIPR